MGSRSRILPGEALGYQRSAFGKDALSGDSWQAFLLIADRRQPIADEPHVPYPRRIVCLTEETTETLYLLGEGDRVVGISGYTVRPPEARQKPKVSSFLHARYEKIEALAPDLILAFSDLQADITTELVRRGYPVFTFNQRSVAEILQMIRVLGGIIGVPAKAETLAARLGAGLETIRQAASAFPRRPRVYFEEWDHPLISGIQWVEELIEIAGGDPVFPQLRHARLGKDRIVTSEQVIAAQPDVIIGSWCGKPVRPGRIRARPGWDVIPAVRDGHIDEIKSTYILQPGPASLTEGVARLHRIIARAAHS
jgi:iron complex transport system substrate-binding protein